MVTTFSDGPADVALIGNHDEVGDAVVVEVIDGDLPRLCAGRKGRAGSVVEAAMSVAQEDGNGAVVEVGGDDVGMAVAIEVGGAEAFVGAAAGGEKRAGSEQPAGAVAEDQFDLVVAPAVGDGVGLAVGVEVAHDDTMGMRVGVDVDGRAGSEAESAATVAKKDAQIRRLMIGDDEVRMAVAIHVGDGDVVGEMAGGERRTRRRMEGAVAVAKQNHDGAMSALSAASIGNDDVGIVVVVDVGDGDPARAGAGGNGDLTEAGRLRDEVALRAARTKMGMRRMA